MKLGLWSLLLLSMDWFQSWIVSVFECIEIVLVHVSIQTDFADHHHGAKQIASLPQGYEDASRERNQ